MLKKGIRKDPVKPAPAPTDTLQVYKQTDRISGSLSDGSVCENPPPNRFAFKRNYSNTPYYYNANKPRPQDHANPYRGNGFQQRKRFISVGDKDQTGSSGYETSSKKDKSDTSVSPVLKSYDPVMENRVSSTNNDLVYKFTGTTPADDFEVVYTIKERVVAAAYAIVYNNCKLSSNKFESMFDKPAPDFQTIFAWRRRLINSGCLIDSHKEVLNTIQNVNKAVPTEKENCDNKPNSHKPPIRVPNPEEIPLSDSDDEGPNTPDVNKSPLLAERHKSVSAENLHNSGIENEGVAGGSVSTLDDRGSHGGSQSASTHHRTRSSSRDSSYSESDLERTDTKIVKKKSPSIKSNNTRPSTQDSSDSESVSYNSEEVDFRSRKFGERRKVRRKQKKPSVPVTPVNNYIPNTNPSYPGYSTVKPIDHSPLTTGNIYTMNLQNMAVKPKHHESLVDTDGCSIEYVPTRLAATAKKNYQDFKDNVKRKGFWAKANGNTYSNKPRTNNSIEQKPQATTSSFFENRRINYLNGHQEYNKPRSNSLTEQNPQATSDFTENPIVKSYPNVPQPYNKHRTDHYAERNSQATKTNFTVSRKVNDYLNEPQSQHYDNPQSKTYTGQSPQATFTDNCKLNNYFIEPPPYNKPQTTSYADQKPEATKSNFVENSKVNNYLNEPQPYNKPQSKSYTHQSPQAMKINFTDSPKTNTNEPQPYKKSETNSCSEQKQKISKSNIIENSGINTYLSERQEYAASPLQTVVKRNGSDFTKDEFETSSPVAQYLPFDKPLETAQTCNNLKMPDLDTSSVFEAVQSNSAVKNRSIMDIFNPSQIEESPERSNDLEKFDSARKIYETTWDEDDDALYGVSDPVDTQPSNALCRTPSPPMIGSFRTQSPVTNMLYATSKDSPAKSKNIVNVDFTNDTFERYITLLKDLQGENDNISPSKLPADLPTNLLSSPQNELNKNINQVHQQQTNIDNIPLPSEPIPMEIDDEIRSLLEEREKSRSVDTPKTISPSKKVHVLESITIRPSNTQNDTSVGNNSDQVSLHKLPVVIEPPKQKVLLQYLSPQKVLPQNASPLNVSPQNVSPQNAFPLNMSPQNSLPQNVSPQKALQQNVSTEIEMPQNADSETSTCVTQELPQLDLSNLLSGINANTIMLALQNLQKLSQQSNIDTHNSNVDQTATTSQDNQECETRPVETINLTNDEDWENESNQDERIERELEKLDGNTGDTPFLGDIFDPGPVTIPPNLSKKLNLINLQSLEDNKKTQTPHLNENAPVIGNFKSFALPKPIMLNRLKLAVKVPEKGNKAHSRKQAKRSKKVCIITLLNIIAYNKLLKTYF